MHLLNHWSVAESCTRQRDALEECVTELQMVDSRSDDDVLLVSVDDGGPGFGEGGARNPGTCEILQPPTLLGKI